MKLSKENTFYLSASDLTHNLSCKHLTNLNMAEVKGEIKKPYYYDADLEKIIQLGYRHEQAYIQHLRDKGLKVVELRDYDEKTALQRTISAMQDGSDIIVQAILEDGIWNGRADILQKVSKVSDLGD